MSEYFIQDNLNQDDYDNDFYYLKENKDEINKDELNENIYQEDFEHGNQHMYSPSSPHQSSHNTTHATYPTNHAFHNATHTTTTTTAPVNPPKSSNKKSNYFQKNWLYIFLLILIIALVVYYLIDKKYIKLPSFESKSTLSPSPSSSPSTLGSTFMSLH
jgi:hypothetical protein